MTSALSASVNMSPRWYISAMDLPTVLYIYNIEREREIRVATLHAIVCAHDFITPLDLSILVAKVRLFNLCVCRECREDETKYH